MPDHPSQDPAPQPAVIPALSLPALCLAVLLPSLGTSIANVALPDLARSLGVPAPEAQWVVIAYLLALTASIVGAGRAGDLWGHRKVLICGIALFTLASGAAALAPGLGLLVAFRALQGLGAAAMMALTLAMVGALVPPQRAGRAIGLLGTVSAMGTATGPVLGGLLLQLFGWRAVFVALTVAGALTLAAGLRAFPRTAAIPVAGAGRGFDLAGMLLLALALGALARAATAGDLRLLALAALALAGFLAVEARVPSPLLPLARLAVPGRARGLAAMALVTSVLMATLVVGPFHLGQGLGLSPASTGLALSLGPVVAAMAGVPAGRLIDRHSAAAMAPAGLALILTGALFLCLLPAHLGLAGYLAAIALITAGYALFQAANSAALMAATDEAEKGVTSALLGLARNLGLIAGASVMGACYARAAATGGPASGLRLSFGLGAALVLLALTLIWRPGRTAPQSKIAATSLDAAPSLISQSRR